MLGIFGKSLKSPVNILLYSKQNVTCRLVDTNFIFECSIWYLTLTSERGELVRYHAKHLEDKNHVHTWAYPLCSEWLKGTWGYREYWKSKALVENKREQQVRKPAAYNEWLCSSRNNPYPPHGRSSEIPRGREVLKAKFFEAMYENKLEFPGGRGGAKQKIIHRERMDIIFLELHT